MEDMKNAEVRAEAVRTGVKLWQVAEAMGIADTSLSRKLRHELTEEERDNMMAVIHKLAAKKE